MSFVGKALLSVLACLVAFGVAGGGAAVAGERFVPATKIFTRTDKQAGKLVLADWTIYDGSFCLTQTSDGTPLFQADWAAVEPGAPLKIRFDKEEKPSRVVIRKWTQLSGAKAVGTGDSVPYELSKKLFQDRWVWIATIRPQFANHLFLRVKGVWNDTSPCDGTQRATWLFHVRAS